MVFYTPSDIADILKISYDTALTWIKTSGVEYFMVGRQYRVTKASFEKMFVSAEKPPIRQKLRTRPVYVIERK